MLIIDINNITKVKDYYIFLEIGSKARFFQCKPDDNENEMALIYYKNIVIECYEVEMVFEGIIIETLKGDLTLYTFPYDDSIDPLRWLTDKEGIVRGSSVSKFDKWHHWTWVDEVIAQYES